MNALWLENYLTAWSDHCKGQTKDADRMCEASSPAIQYGDINMAAGFEGHAGVREMCKLASTILPGAFMRIEHQLIQGDRWATRWILEGKQKDKDVAYRIEGCSWGQLDQDGKVLSQRDYWNPAHYEAQTGTSLFPSDS